MASNIVTSLGVDRPSTDESILTLCSYKPLMDIDQLVFTSSLKPLHMGNNGKLHGSPNFTRIPPSEMDKIIAMNRYQEEIEGEFILLGTIIRSCYLTPISSSPGYYYLNNLAAGCTDLYLRCPLIDVD
jgi:hypothetical protein